MVKKLKTILVTGGAGFIGSNFIKLVLDTRPETKVINLDKLTYAGSLDNLRDCEKSANYEFVKGDICDRSIINSVFANNKIDGIFHFAAESHVDNSISNPAVFVETNVLGTFNLVDAARKQWMSAPNFRVAGHERSRFLHVSTDEVYGTLGDTGAFTESTPYAPNSPYSATKAGSDLIVRSYFHTYGLNVVTSNCSNNYGPQQNGEKLIPTVIRRALAGKSIPIYGNGLNVRDWLYVTDHCQAILDTFDRGVAGESYNVGARNELTNIEIVKIICAILNELSPSQTIGDYSRLMTFVDDRPGHDRRYAIDPAKIENEIGWKPKETFKSGLRKTVMWYLENRGE